MVTLLPSNLRMFHKKPWPYCMVFLWNQRRILNQILDSDFTLRNCRILNGTSNRARATGTCGTLILQNKNIKNHQ
jgi:hypothetical protein